jgi:hypothetical protein
MRRRPPGTKSASKEPQGDPRITEVFFVIGALLVSLGFVYALLKSWPALDPLSLVMLAGVGLLLVVVCERLRLILTELRRLTALIHQAVTEAPGDPSR